MRVYTSIRKFFQSIDSVIVKFFLDVAIKRIEFEVVDLSEIKKFNLENRQIIYLSKNSSLFTQLLLNYYFIQNGVKIPGLSFGSITLFFLPVLEFLKLFKEIAFEKKMKRVRLKDDIYISLKEDSSLPDYVWGKIIEKMSLNGINMS